MRFRGRRVALLLAGAFPLLADEPNPLATAAATAGNLNGINSHTNDNGEHQDRVIQENYEAGEFDEDENDDNIPLPTVEAIHEDAFRLPPLPSTVAIEAASRGSSSSSSSSIVSSSSSSSGSKIENSNDKATEEEEQRLPLVRKASGIPLGGGSQETDNDLSEKSQPLSSEDDDLPRKQEDKQNPEQRSENNGKSQIKVSHSEEESSSLNPQRQGQQMVETEASDSIDETVSSENETNEKAEIVPEKSDADKVDGSPLSQNDAANEPASNPSDGLSTSIGENSDGKEPQEEKKEQQEETESESSSNGNSSEVDQEPVDDEEEHSRDHRVDVDYASKSAGALILEKSKNLKGTSNLLNADKDKYAITPCEEKNKFVVIGLSEDILVKKIILANYERYSSRVKEFKILGSQNLGNKWVDLGTYTAKAGNGEQTFELIEPTWARYLKFRFLNHHGSEHFCTVSQIKVHGSTMLQGFHEQWGEDEVVLNDDAPIMIDVDDTASDPSESPPATNSGVTSLSDQQQTDDEPVSSTADQQANEGISTNEVNQSESSAKQANLGTETLTKKSADSSTNNIDPKATSKELQTPNDTIKAPLSDCALATLTGESIPIPCMAFKNYVPPDETPMFGPFRQSEYLDDLLHGNSLDEQLFSTIYEMIPRTMTSLPCAGRSCDERDMRTPISELGTAAIQSLYTSTLMATDAAKALVAESGGTIAAPKMTDAVQEVIRMVRETVGSSGKTITSQAGFEMAESGENKSNGDVPNDETTSERVKSERTGSQTIAQSDIRSAQSDSGKESSSTNSYVDDGTDTIPAQGKHQRDSSSESITEPTPSTLESESLHTMDVSLAKMLERLPSADCLASLDYTEFKAKLLASRKGASDTPSGGSMEPIFKKLTDEIKSLQMSLSVHDQFTKASVSCYQRILLDLIVEVETMRADQNVRLLRLEDEFHRARSSNLLSIVSSLALQVLSWFYSFNKVIISYVLSLAPTMYGAIMSEYVTSIWSWIGQLQEGIEMIDPESPFDDKTQHHNGLSPDTETSWSLPILPALCFLVGCRLLMMTTKATATKWAKLSKRQQQRIHEDDQVPPLTDESVTESKES